MFGKIPPHKRLTINVHLDGMRETHDYVCAREGVFDKAIEMIREAKRLGYHVMTNTTVFKETDVDEIEELCALVTELGVDGMLVSPGYHYESVKRGHLPHPAGDPARSSSACSSCRSSTDLTRRRCSWSSRPGMREYECSPWSTVTFTPRGWKGPCYLIGETLHRRLGRVLDQDRLGLLGVAQGRALPELRDALGLRGVGRAPALEEPARHDAHGGVEPPGLSAGVMCDGRQPLGCRISGR